jgi:hypothetical protein
VFIAAFLDWAAAAHEHPLSPYAFGVHGRELLARHRSAVEPDSGPWRRNMPTAETDDAAAVRATVQAFLHHLA